MEGKLFIVKEIFLPLRENFLLMRENILLLRENFLPLGETFLSLRENILLLWENVLPFSIIVDDLGLLFWDLEYHFQSRFEVDFNWI